MLPKNLLSPIRLLLRRSSHPLFAALLAVFAVLPATAQGPNVTYTYASNIGSGFQGASSVAVDSADNVFVASISLYKETLNSDGTFTQSTISTGAGQIISLATDSSGDLYVLDGVHVFKETLSGGSYTESTVASGLNFAGGVAVDATGNVYVNETGTGRVLVEKLSGGTYTQMVIASGLTTAYGGGGIAVDTAGNVYVCDPGDNLVLKETLANGTYTQSAVIDSSTPVINGVTNININHQFTATGVSFDPFGNLLVASPNFGIFRGIPNGNAYSFKNIAVNTSTILGASGAAINSHGDLYLAGSGNLVALLLANELAETSSAENFGSQNLGTTTAAQTATFTFDVGGTLAAVPYAVSTQGDLTLDFQPVATQAANVCVAGKTYNRGDTCTVTTTFSPTRPGARYGAIALFAPSGTPIATSYLQGVGVGPQVSFSPGLPSNNLGQGYDSIVTVDSSNNYYFNGALVSFTNAHPVTSVPQSNSVFTTGYPGYNYYFNGSGDGYGFGAVIDGAGNIVITDAVTGETSVAAYDLNPAMPSQMGNGGTLIGNYGPAFLAGVPSPPTSATPAYNGRPAIDGAGNLYFSDDNQNQILEEQYIHGWYNKQIVIATGLNNPGDVVVDAAGAVYAADTGNNRIVKETPNGDGTFTQTVVDSGFAYPPEGLAIDRIGNLYVSLFNDVPGSLPFILKETFANNTYIQSTLPLRSAVGLDVDSAGNVFAVQTGDGNFNTLAAINVAAPPSLMFASTAVGSTSSDSPQTVTIVNNGNASLIIAGSPAISVGFTLSSGSTCPSATVAPQASCTFLINFVPTQNGVDNGTLTVADNHLGNPGATQIIKLNGQATGTGTVAATLTPSAYNYGSVTVAGSATQSFTLANTGTSSIHIASASLPNTVFTTSSTTCGTSLAASASCTYTIAFRPTAAGAQTTTFTVTDDAGAQTSALTGTGAQAAAPQAALTPGTASFGPITAGTASTPITFTITNAGNAVLSITSFGISGTNASSFQQGSSTCGSSLASGASCTIIITFTPASAGAFSATLSVVDTIGTQTSPLTGTATAASVSAVADFTIAATPPTQSGAHGTAVTYLVQLASASSTNPFTNAVTLSAAGLPAGASVSFSPMSVVPGATQPATSNMTVTIAVLTSRNDQTTTPYPLRDLPAGLSMASLCLVWRYRRQGKRLGLLTVLLLLLGLAGAATALTGCSSTTTGFAIPNGTSTITITGTSGTTVHSTTVTLTIK